MLTWRTATLPGWLAGWVRSDERRKNYFLLGGLGQSWQSGAMGDKPSDLLY